MTSKIIVYIIVGMIALVALPTLAQTVALDSAVNQALNYGTITGLGTRDVREVIMLIISVILAFLGVLSILIIFFGIFGTMTSGGNEDAAARAKTTIIAGFIGLTIVFISYALASFVVRTLVNVTT